MPFFTAPIVVDRQLPIGDVFALSVAGPMLSSGVLAPPMTAYLSPDVDHCCISETLARQFYPPVQEGDIILLTIVEEKEQGVVHQYPFAVPVHFAKSKLPDYIQISLNHAHLMFDISEYMPMPHESHEARRLDLKLRCCVEHPAQSAEEFAPA